MIAPRHLEEPDLPGGRGPMEPRAKQGRVVAGARGGIGYDLDGVISSTIPEKDLKEMVKGGLDLSEFFPEQWPLLTDEFFEGEVVVITSRDPGAKSMTEWWLKFYYPETTFKLYCVGYDDGTKKRKLEVMKQEGITVFLDDSQTTIEYVRKHGIKGIHVADRGIAP